jgi:hypothetical protein
MSTANALPSDDPLGGPVAGYWSFGFDMPDELGGGFVTGQLLLRGDGVLLRRYSRFVSAPDGKPTPGHGPWEEVSWWTPERDPQRAARVLHYRGYDLHKLDIARDRQQHGPAV